MKPESLGSFGLPQAIPGLARTPARAPAHPVPPSASLAWQTPDDPGSFLELTEAVQIT